MANKFLTNIDLSNNQLLNAKLQQLGSDITASGNTGIIYYNTATNQAKISNGTSIDNITNILESIGVGTANGLSVSGVAGKNQNVSLALATSGANGAMSSSDFSKLAAATASNTVSTLVLRDGSGNFSAGTITASLTGTASNASNLNNQAASYYLSRANHTGTQLSSTISDLAATVQAYRLDQFAAPTTAVSFNSQRITNVATPTAATDAVNKAYVDGIASSLDIKASVRAASTGNVAGTYNATGGASGRGQFTAMTNTVDGVTFVANDRVLLKDQTTGAQNGIWVVTTAGTGSNGVWDRASDFDQDAEVTAGAFTFVEEGTVNADSGWVLTTNNPITIGGSSGTALAFAQFSGAGTILAGNGLTKTGSTLSAVGTAGRISVGAGGIDIDSSYVGQTSITTLGTIATGTWQGSAVGLAYGGTGATSAAGAKTNLGFLTRYAQTLSTSTTSYAVTHNLGTLDVLVQLVEVATGAIVYADFVVTNTNTVTINFGTAPAANAYRVVVVG